MSYGFGLDLFSLRTNCPDLFYCVLFGEIVRGNFLIPIYLPKAGSRYLLSGMSKRRNGK